MRCAEPQPETPPAPVDPRNTRTRGSPRTAIHGVPQNSQQLLDVLYPKRLER